MELCTIGYIQLQKDHRLLIPLEQCEPNKNTPRQNVLDVHSSHIFPHTHTHPVKIVHPSSLHYFTFGLVRILATGTAASYVFNCNGSVWTLTHSFFRTHNFVKQSMHFDTTLNVSYLDFHLLSYYQTLHVQRSNVLHF